MGYLEKDTISGANKTFLDYCRLTSSTGTQQEGN